jgi:H+-transporting ATPase
MPDGLTTAEAARRLQQYGANALPEEHPRPLLEFVKKLWGPVPWMLEVAIILEVVLDKYVEGIVIGALLIFNAIIGTIQEKRSQDALAVLKQELRLTARVLRDGTWQPLPADQLVPGDVIHVRMGDLVPADLNLTEGTVSLDQSALTGESLPVEAEPGQPAYTGTTVKHGEATGNVVATGIHTKFGKTAELVRLAKTKSHLQEIVLSIVRYLVIIDGFIAVVVLAVALLGGVSFRDIVPFVLILMVASVPVALPATFTIATALGAQELARKGVLVTRLAAVEEAAAMDVLCSDKTGTITANSLAVATVLPYPPATEADVLAAAAMASDDRTQDPIDLAILAEASAKHAAPDPSSRLSFVPFDSATKRSEATYQQGKDEIHAAKGAPRWIAPLCTSPAETMGQDEAQLAAQGHRVLAIAAGTDNTLQLTGLIALHDPPRADSQNLIKRLKAAGIRIIMVTGDGLATARAVAASVGIGERACGPERLRSGPQASSDDQIDNCDVIAEVLPEDKFALVQALQARGHTTGMTGDGVNDAPALKQAQVGVAVANATDVAKAAASMVLTQPGLGNIVAAVEESRRIYQRMLTYTLNKIIKTVNIVLFLSLGFIFTRDFVVTPLLIVLMMFANDFATMSIATDRVVPSPKPDRWNIRSLIVASIAIGTLIVALSFLVWWLGADVWHLSMKAQQTLNFVMLVFSGQGTIYLVRERRHFWRSRPSRILLISSVADLIVIGLLAGFGVLMTAIPVSIIAATVALILGYLALVDFAKLYLFADLHM